VLVRQMEELVRALPASLRASGALEVSPLPSSGRASGGARVFGRAAEEEDLRRELPNDLRQSLRDTLVRALPVVLDQEDLGAD